MNMLPGPGRWITVGRDGASMQMVEYREPCGCSWTRDRSARLRVCTACLIAAAPREFQFERGVSLELTEAGRAAIAKAEGRA